jgi:uncharacterized membrane protein
MVLLLVASSRTQGILQHYEHLVSDLVGPLVGVLLIIFAHNLSTFLLIFHIIFIIVGLIIGPGRKSPTKSAGILEGLKT